MSVLVRRLIAVGVVLVVVIIGVSFVIFRDRLPASATELQVGDCFDIEDPTSSSVEQVPHHPCTEAHQYEVFFNGTDALGKDAPYPDLSVFEADAQNQCKPAFAAYVGTSLDDSILNIGYLYPQSEGWSSGDRTITCYITRDDNVPLTSSMKGSKQ